MSIEWRYEAFRRVIGGGETCGVVGKSFGVSSSRVAQEVARVRRQCEFHARKLNKEANGYDIIGMRVDAQRWLEILNSYLLHKSELVALEDLKPHDVRHVDVTIRLWLCGRAGHVHQVKSEAEHCQLSINQRHEQSALTFAQSSLRICELGLSARTHSCLGYEGVKTIAELFLKFPKSSDLLRTPNFGRKSRNDLLQALADHGIVYS